MVDIIVGTISPVHNNASNRDDKRRPPPPKKKKQRERRKNQVDRRQDVRDGVVVTLSIKSNRRKSPDRRRTETSSCYPPGMGTKW